MTVGQRYAFRIWSKWPQSHRLSKVPLHWYLAMEIWDCFTEGKYLHFDRFTLLAACINPCWEEPPTTAVQVVPPIAAIVQRKEDIKITDGNIAPIKKALHQKIGMICIPMLFEEHYTMFIIWHGVHLTHFNSSDLTYSNESKMYVKMTNADRMERLVGDRVKAFMLAENRKKVETYKICYYRYMP